MAIAPSVVRPVVAQGAPTRTDAVPTWVFKAVPNDTQANRQSNQAVQLLKDGKPKEALALLQQALALPKEEGTDLPALLNRTGVAHNRLGDQAAALGFFEKSGYPPAVYNSGVSTLKVAIADAGQSAAFAADKASVDASKLDGAAVSKALGFLAKAIGTNGEMFTKMAREDTDWAPLVKNAEFRALVGLEPLPASAPAVQVGSSFGAPAAPQPKDTAAADGQKWYGANQKGLGFEEK